MEHFTKVFGPDLGKQVRAVSPETMNLLAAHDWPGNVRELQSTIKYALVHATGEILTHDCLPENWCMEASAAGMTRPGSDAETIEGALSHFVRRLLHTGQT